MRALFLLAPLALLGCTPSAADQARIAGEAETTQAELDRALAGFTPDSHDSCLHTSLYRGSQSTRAYGKTLLFRVSPRLIYRTDTAGGCERVGDDEYLVTSTPTSDLCRGDIAHTVDRASQHSMGACSFGDFVAYRRR